MLELLGSLPTEAIVAASVIISLLSYFLSYKLPNFSQGRMLRTVSVVLVFCSAVFGWASTDSIKFGFFTIVFGFVPMLIHIIWRYFRDHLGLFNNAADNVTPANFQFNKEKPTPKIKLNVVTESVPETNNAPEQETAGTTK